MPEYLSPGVYVEEISTGPRPIEGVSTSNAGFVGQTERGPTEPRLVTSWPEYQRWYGGTIETSISYLPFAVRGFFENGGQRLFVRRVIGGNAILATATASTANDNMIIDAIGDGIWGNNLLVRVQAASQADTEATPPRNWFRITVLYYSKGIPDPFIDPTDREALSNPERQEPDVLEDFDDLTAEPGSSNFVERVINAASQLIRIRFDDGSGNPGAPGRPDDQDFPNLQLNSGSDGDIDLTSYETALNDLRAIDEISLLAAPDEVNSNVENAAQITGSLINQCEILRDRFAILSIGQGTPVEQVEKPRDSTYAAVYFPWLRVFDPLTQRDVLVPPVGHMAGIYARTDVNRGVHKAPANEVVRGLYFGDPNGLRQPLELRITKRQHDILNPKGINVIRDFRSDGRGIRVWGARTISSDSQWKYINVRRLFLFVEESIEEGTQWVVFEPNHEPTWAAVRRSLTNFLITVWRSGALMGVTQDEAFFVKCDRTTMTQDDIDNGRLICFIGIAPVKPAEFVIFRISQKTVEATA